MTTSDEKGTVAPQVNCDRTRATAGIASSRRFGFRGLIAYVTILTILFAVPLARLAIAAAHSYLQSYILLVPFIMAYLLYIRRGQLLIAGTESVAGTLTFGAIAFLALAAGIEWRQSLSVDDGLTLMILAYVSFLFSGGFLFMGAKWMKTAAFPVSFLIFMVPLPDPMILWLENASANGSAAAAAVYFRALGTPLVQHGRTFELPGIVLEVAQECSGIHSSLVLFITSLIASQMFLRTWWARLALVTFVFPLGILRNGFRIVVVGLLCVHLGPQMINSSIHRHGGPIFFVLSLIPLLLLLMWLRRSEMIIAKCGER